MMNYEEAVSYIYGIPKFTKKNSLEHTKRLLEMLRNPEKSFRILHVAGSNGKGSVCAFSDAVLRQAGIHTGLFTSPHLCTIRERFVIDGQMITEGEFLEDFSQILQLVQEAEKENLSHPTFFEFIFLMCMVRFQKSQVDVAILETGLGGRLDATNAVENKIATVITSIGLEHTDILGNTIEQIAAEKGGIIRSNVPVIYDASIAAVNQVLKNLAAKAHAPMIPVKQENCEIFRNTAKGIDFCYRSSYDDISVHIGMGANYQVLNAALAMEAIQYFIPEEQRIQAVQDGIGQTKWPGRMEEVLPEIYLDGAHNVPGIQAFLQSVQKLRIEKSQESGNVNSQKAVLLFSIVKDKNYEQVLHELLCSNEWEQIIVTQIHDKRGINPYRLEQLIKEQSKIPVSCIADTTDAFSYAKSQKRRGQLLFCAGSLYLVGELEQIIRRNENDRF